MSLGGKFVEVAGATEDASAGGYAVEQTEEFKKKQADLIDQHARAADVVICTAQIPGRKAPLLIRKETVAGMKHGSVLIDLAASTGGNCELTQNGKTVVEHGVQLIGKSDYPSDMAFDASSMYGKNMLNFLKLRITSYNVCYTKLLRTFYFYTEFDSLLSVEKYNPNNEIVEIQRYSYTNQP